MKGLVFALMFFIGQWAGANNLLIKSVTDKSPSADEIAPRDAGCTCNSAVHDRFEEPAKFGFGPFKGQCVDACRFRRILFISEKEARKFGADESHSVVANVLHNHKYWIARVPLTRTTEVDADFERFFSNISHSVLRFRFATSDPVLLYKQDGPLSSLKPRPVQKLYDLVLSVEAVPPKNHRFDFFESSFGKYLLDYRVLSIQEAVQFMIDEKHHSVKQFSLRLDGPTRERVLRASLMESNQKSFKSAYNLLTNNCATSIMNVVDRETGYHPSMLDWLGLVQWQRAFPIDSYFGTIYALGAMRLLNEQSQKPNLEVEYGRTSL